MTHTYHITGMTCTGCQAKVHQLLASVLGVNNVMIDLPSNEATIDMSAHIETSKFQAALKDYPKYSIEEKHKKQQTVLPAEKEKSWLVTYKPIVMVFAYITGITLLSEAMHAGFSWQNWMQNFMAAFFLVFSFFKLLDVKAFAESYSSYDIVAKKWMGWGYVYAFTELALGIAYLTRFIPLFTNIFTLVIMIISITGVLQSVLRKRKIQCACFGAIFNLPMSTVTIIEDGLMIVMCCLMLFSL